MLLHSAWFPRPAVKYLYALTSYPIRLRHLNNPNHSEELIDCLIIQHNLLTSCSLRASSSLVSEIIEEIFSTNRLIVGLKHAAALRRPTAQRR